MFPIAMPALRLAGRVFVLMRKQTRNRPGRGSRLPLPFFRFTCVRCRPGNRARWPGIVPGRSCMGQACFFPFMEKTFYGLDNCQAAVHEEESRPSAVLGWQDRTAMTQPESRPDEKSMRGVPFSLAVRPEFAANTAGHLQFPKAEPVRANAFPAGRKRRGKRSGRHLR